MEVSPRTAACAWIAFSAILAYTGLIEGVLLIHTNTSAYSFVDIMLPPPTFGAQIKNHAFVCSHVQYPYRERVSFNFADSGVHSWTA